MRLLVAALLLLAPLAGCIQPPEDPEATSHAARDAPVEGAFPVPADRIDGMTAQESKEDSAMRCDGGVTVPPGSWCAQRVLTVTGRIGLDALPLVDLRSVNGGIRVATGPGDAWSLVATIKTRGLTEEDARRALDEGWAWSHEDDEGGHHLRAAPRPAVPIVGASVVGAEYVVVLPGWLALDEVSLKTTNGAVEVGFFEMRTLRAQTTNGGLDLAGWADDVTATTTNGKITANLRPSKSGEWRLDTTNGDVRLLVAEYVTRGYDIDGRTTNGRVQIDLSQGEVVEDERTHKRARTHGFDERPIQTTVRLETTNGDVTVLH